jgi:hypothetical protein
MIKLSGCDAKIVTSLFAYTRLLAQVLIFFEFWRGIFIELFVSSLFKYPVSHINCHSFGIVLNISAQEYIKIVIGLIICVLIKQLFF